MTRATHHALAPRRVRVLVVDDDEAVRDLVAAILGDEGYDVRTLDHSADEAVGAVIDQVEPDCILLDGADPIGYVTGWTTAAAIRCRTRPIPTIMFTGHVIDADEAESATSERAMSAGFAGVLRKPFHVQELVSMIERLAGAPPRDLPSI